MGLPAKERTQKIQIPTDVFRRQKQQLFSIWSPLGTVGKVGVAFLSHIVLRLRPCHGHPCHLGLARNVGRSSSALVPPLPTEVQHQKLAFRAQLVGSLQCQKPGITHRCIHACTSIHAHVCINVYVCVVCMHTYLCTHSCLLFKYTGAYLYVYIYIHIMYLYDIHMYIYIDTYAQSPCTHKSFLGGCPRAVPGLAWMRLSPSWPPWRR